MISLLPVFLKIAVSAGMVLSITMVAERASARFAGVLMGFPLGAGLSLFFIGLEQGPVFAADSALWCIPGLLAILGFAWGYLEGIKRLEKKSAWGIVVCVVLGLSGFFIMAFSVRYFLPENIWIRSLVVAIILLGCIVRFSTISVHKIQGRIPLTPLLIGSRAGFAATVVLLITGAAEMIGPQWSGIFSIFPTTVLPTVVVLHHHYGSMAVKGLFREFPLGLLAIMVFALTVSLSYPSFGIYTGTFISYVAASAYLFLYEMKLRSMITARLYSARS